MSERAPRPPWQRFRAALDAAGFRPSKRLGQNFLLDENTARAIVEDAELPSAAHVVEVGPGCGFLSVHLAHAVGRLVCLEVDPRLVPVATEFLEPYPHAEVVEADALAGKHALGPAWASAVPEEGPWHLVANLPYSISAPVLALVAGLERPPQSFTVLVQEELADEAGDETELGKKLRKGLGQLAGVAAEALAERTELYVASVYSLDIAGESHVFVGVAGQFIPVRNK